MACCMFNSDAKPLPESVPTYSQLGWWFPSEAASNMDSRVFPNYDIIVIIHGLYLGVKHYTMYQDILWYSHQDTYVAIQ